MDTKEETTEIDSNVFLNLPPANQKLEIKGEREKIADEIVNLLASKHISIDKAERILETARRFLYWAEVRPRFSS